MTEYINVVSQILEYVAFIYFFFSNNALRNFLRFFLHITCLWFAGNLTMTTLSKYPGGHPILHRELKLNSKISAGKYKKN